jgi:asparagine synthase (glutamine-hydrolysing)
MCGILAVFCPGGIFDPQYVQTCKERLAALTHRGPDKQHSLALPDKQPSMFLGHTRLCIQGSSTSRQPILYQPDKARAPTYVCANAEIYNATDILGSSEFETDCLAIPAVLQETDRGTRADVIRAINKLDGVFSFVSVQKTCLTVARSLCGVMNLYYGWDPESQALIFTSERKAYPSAWLRPFPPSHVLSIELSSIPLLYRPDDPASQIFKLLEPYMSRLERLVNPVVPPTQAIDVSRFRQLLVNAVEKRLKTVRLSECGFLLSGGLDSSVIVAIARMLYPDTKIRTFSIGLAGGGSSDLPVAEKVAEFLGTSHTAITFTVEDGLDSLPAVVQALETIDTTTVRAGTPMYLLIRKIKKMHPELKVLFSGEGADELLYGYLTWHESPNLGASRTFSTYLLERLHQFDVLRAHQTGMAHGVEVRVPFLDKEFVRYVTQLHPAFLTPLCGKEKYFLRKAFQHMLPSCVVDRQKEQFSDGVGNAWIDSLRKASHRDLSLPEETLKAFGDEHTTREQLQVFDLCRQALGEHQFKLICQQFDTWVPQFSKSRDPSGRSSLVHVQKLKP